MAPVPSLFSATMKNYATLLAAVETVRIQRERDALNRGSMRPSRRAENRVLS
jgi:hypothetical protein